MNLKEKEKLLQIFYRLKDPNVNEEYQSIIEGIDRLNKDKEENEHLLLELNEELSTIQEDKTKVVKGTKVIRQMLDATKKDSNLEYTLEKLGLSGSNFLRTLGRIAIPEEGESDKYINNVEGKIDVVNERIQGLKKLIEEAEYEKNITELENKKIEIEEIISYLQAIYQNAMDESIRNEIPSELESRLIDLMGLSLEDAKLLQGILQNEHSLLVEYDSNKRLREPRQVSSFSPYRPIVNEKSRNEFDNLTSNGSTEEKTSVSSIIKFAKETNDSKNSFADPFEKISKLEEEAEKELKPISEPRVDIKIEKPIIDTFNTEVNKQKSIDYEESVLSELSQLKTNMEKPEKKVSVGDSLLEYGLWFDPEMEKYIETETNIIGLLRNLEDAKVNGIDIKTQLGLLKIIFDNPEVIKGFIKELSLDMDFVNKVKLLKELGFNSSDISIVLNNVLKSSVEEIQDNYLHAVNKANITEVFNSVQPLQKQVVGGRF